MSNDNDKDQEYQKNMGKRLRKIRKENALSQDDVADALGICTKQYQSINTQWMLNRINYVLVIKMESAIIESDKRLSNQMCVYRLRRHQNCKYRLRGCQNLKYRRKRCQNLKYRKKRHHFEKYRRKHTPKFKISKKTYTILKNIEKNSTIISCGGRQ